MTLWTCLGLAMAISHHFLYRSLRGRAVKEQLSFGKTNYPCRREHAMAHTNFQVAISLSFIQQFWSQTRRKSFSAKQINATINMRNNSLSFSALKIFPSTVQLFAVALIIFSLSVLSVVIPGLSHSRPGFYWTKLLCSYKANTRMRLHGVLPPVLYHLYRNSRPK